MIDWQALDWQSFATLSTGGAAVIGAVVIGWRQSGIAKRQADITEAQTEILNRQLQLEETKLRVELFDKRFAVFDAVNTLVIHLTSGDGTIKETLLLRFLDVVEQSRFLFKPAVYASLEELQNITMSIIMLRSQLPIRIVTDDATLTQRAKDIRERLPSIFGEELSMSGVGVSMIAGVS